VLRRFQRRKMSISWVEPWKAHPANPLIFAVFGHL
jgi:hypothetical protein